MFCCTLLYVHSSFTIILMGKRELVALLGFCSWCLVMVVWLFLAVPWVCLRFVSVVFSEHTHLLYLAHLSENGFQLFSKNSCSAVTQCGFINIFHAWPWVSAGRPNIIFLFVLCEEILAAKIRKDIKGIKINGNKNFTIR